MRERDIEHRPLVEKAVGIMSVLASGISWHDATKFRARGLMGVPVRLPYLGPYSLVVPCYYPVIDFVVSEITRSITVDAPTSCPTAGRDHAGRGRPLRLRGSGAAHATALLGSANTGGAR
jgi:hypothetical protein